MESVRLASGVAVEDLGDEIVVLVEDRVVTLSNRHSDSLRLVLRKEELNETSERLVDDLVQLGICERTSAGLSRRGFVGAGVGLAGVVVGGIALPSVAVATSSQGWEEVDGYWSYLVSPEVEFTLEIADLPETTPPGSGWTLEINGVTIAGLADEGFDPPLVRFNKSDPGLYTTLSEGDEGEIYRGVVSGNGYRFDASFGVD